MNSGIKKLENFMGYTILVSGLVMNALGLLVSFSYMQKDNLINMINIIPAAISFTFILILFILSLFKKSWLVILTDLAVIFTGYVFFPIILFTSHDLAFIPYLGIQGIIFGLTSGGKIKNIFFAAGAILLDVFLIYIKCSIPLRVSHLVNHISTITIAVSVSYLFNFFVSFFLVKYLYKTLADNDKYKLEKIERLSTIQ